MKIALMVVMAFFGLVGVAISGASILGGLDGYAAFQGQAFGTAPTEIGFIAADSEFRFFAGTFLALSLGYLYCLIGIDNKGPLIVGISVGILIGAASRAVGYVETGFIPETAGALIAEIVFPVLILFLHSRVSRS